MQYVTIQCTQPAQSLYGFPFDTPLPNAVVKVWAAGTTTLASLFDKTGTPISNPFSADINGIAKFEAADGVYDIQVQSADLSYTSPLLESLQLFDTSSLIGVEGISLVSATGLLVRTGATMGVSNFAARSITVTSGKLTVSNGDGVAGNPLLSIAAGAITNTEMAAGAAAANLGYAAENVANKDTDTALGGATPSNTKYPSQAASKQYADHVIGNHIDVTGTVSLTSSHYGAVVRVDATGGASTATLPASGTNENDWIAIRKRDSSTNRVTVQNSSGTDVAWLSSQHDLVYFAWWAGAWIPVKWNIGPIKQVFTSSGTWTKAPLAKFVEAVTIDAGAGGGSGRRGAAASARAGGRGGNGGGTSTRLLVASIIGATETVTIGAGGGGGTAQSVDSTDGSSGTNGGASSFGAWLKGTGSSNGIGGSTSAGGAATANASYRGTSPTVATATSVTATVGSPAASAGAAPGGCGGGISTGNTGFDGGIGGNASNAGGTNISGGVGGATGGSGGIAGTDITSTDSQLGGSGGGGGGSNTAGAGGAGANGGAPGGGGGGGGACVNGNNSGAGGAGGRGEVRVTTYF